MPSRRSARPGSAIRRPAPISIGYVVEEGPRVYIERINVRGNTRTRDYVIRRELDVGEGDAYNKVLIDRAERRLNNLGYFKKVRVTNEPGSAPGPGRSSTSTSRISRPARSRSPAATRPRTASSARSRSANRTSSAAASSCGSPARSASARKGVDFSFTEPYFLGYRMAAGFDLFSKFSDQHQVRPLREPRRPAAAAPRPAGDGGVRRHAALFAVPDRT